MRYDFGSIINVALQKGAVDNIDRLCEERRSYRENGNEIYNI